MAEKLDATQIQEWLDALQDVLDNEGAEGAQELLQALTESAGTMGLATAASIRTPYLNSLPPTVDDQESARLSAAEIAGLTALLPYVRWNAAAIVAKANKKASELGGHLSTAAAILDLYQVGLLHFFRGPGEQHRGDMVFFQGHASPANYAHAFLLGRISEEQLNLFRQEALTDGISSYPHPWLMPDFWQFPTVSMGLGPYTAVFQARIMRYLENRKLIAATDRKVWAFCGDGEMLGEPESVGALALAGREQLGNLIFVISCNLQRLDGPVLPYSQVVQELEGIFRGAGWRVIKLIWGEAWDKLFAQDSSGILRQRISELIDGEVQNYAAHGPAYLREHFFAKYPELAAMVADWSDEELAKLNDGGHDWQKIYAAFHAAVHTPDQPVVILAKTIKGYLLPGAQGQNTAHNTKKLAAEDMQQLATNLGMKVTAEQAADYAFIKPDADSLAHKHLRQQRAQLGADLPMRIATAPVIKVPDLDFFAKLLEDSGEREISTTMAYSRVLSALLKDKNLKPHIVPIVPDETRTFGMEGLFRQIGIYSPFGQPYEPVDKKQLMYYREAKDGQLLQEGLSEANGIASWTALATSYANHGVPMVPFYIYYSMFGYQRIGDFVWAAADSRARGFIIGATAGRTTLNGEGLQHEDGHNLMMFDHVPNCRSYDPAFAYEMTVIIQHGLRRMLEDQVDEFYYITAMNENYVMPAMPEGAADGIIKGLYVFKEHAQATDLHVQLLGSGTIFRHVILAAEILEKDYGVTATLWGAPAFNLLRRDIEDVTRHNRLHPDADPKVSHVQSCLQDRPGPVIAATDYEKGYAAQIREHVNNRFIALGTDGFGRSDLRKSLRSFFEVDAAHIAYAALYALAEDGLLPREQLLQAQQNLGIDADRQNPIDL